MTPSYLIPEAVPHPATQSRPVASASPAPLPATLPALALPHGQTGRLVAALLPWLAQGRRCYCLDGGNCFSPYALASEARRQGMNPKPLLERVLVSRAYTCHQLLEGVATMLAPLAERPQPPLALLLGLDRLFLDADIPLGERRRVFERVVARAARLVRRGLPLLATVTHAECGMRSAEYRPFYTQLRILTSSYTIPHAGLRIPGFNDDCGLRSRRPTGPSPLDCGLEEKRAGGNTLAGEGASGRDVRAPSDSHSAIRNPQSAIARR